MTRTNTPWRPSEFERARQLREEGLSWREVGERLGRSEAAMHCMVAVMKAADWDAMDILQDAQPAPSAPPKYTYRHWRPSELAKAREMRAQGATWPEVGAALGRQPDAVAQAASTAVRRSDDRRTDRARTPRRGVSGMEVDAGDEVHPSP